MKHCRKLHEYAMFIACVRTHLATGQSKIEAVNQAIDACIQNGILAEFLMRNRTEVTSMLLTEYDEQAHIDSEREIAKEEGELRSLVSLVCVMLKKNYSVGQIADIFEMDEEQIEQIAIAAKEGSPEYDVDKIVAKLMK